MTDAARTPDPQDPRRGMHPRPKRGRAVLGGTFVGLIVLVFAIILLVSQCGQGEDRAQGAEPRPAAVVVDAAAAPPAG